jgi:hypothetical protein
MPCLVHFIFSGHTLGVDSTFIGVSSNEYIEGSKPSKAMINTIFSTVINIISKSSRISLFWIKYFLTTEQKKIAEYISSLFDVSNQAKQKFCVNRSCYQQQTTIVVINCRRNLHLLYLYNVLSNLQQAAYFWRKETTSNDLFVFIILLVVACQRVLFFLIYMSDLWDTF